LSVRLALTHSSKLQLSMGTYRAAGLSCHCVYSFLREPDYLSRTAAGGAVFAAAAAALSGCTFANNTANYAGAVALAGTSAIDNCTFAGNVCAGLGGAVHVFAPAATVSVTDSVFTDNYAGGQVSLLQKAAHCYTVCCSCGTIKTLHYVLLKTAVPVTAAAAVHGGSVICHHTQCFVAITKPTVCTTDTT
jgi:hypothetical protein